jgi:hypothetical protein
MPTRDEIKPKVIKVLSAVTQMPPKVLSDNEPYRLFQDLGMGPTLRQALAVPYTKISRQYPGGLPISMKEAGDLKTVKESIDLVEKRANGKK